jgi:hypothetical protein
VIVLWSPVPEVGILKEQPYEPFGMEPMSKILISVPGLQQTPPRQSVAPGTSVVPVAQLELVGDPQVPPRLLQLAAEIFWEKKGKAIKRKIMENSKDKIFLTILS